MVRIWWVWRARQGERTLQHHGKQQPHQCLHFCWKKWQENESWRGLEKAPRKQGRVSSSLVASSRKTEKHFKWFVLQQLAWSILCLQSKHDPVHQPSAKFQKVCWAAPCESIASSCSWPLLGSFCETCCCFPPSSIEKDKRRGGRRSRERQLSCKPLLGPSQLSAVALCHPQVLRGATHMKRCVCCCLCSMPALKVLPSWPHKLGFCSAALFAAALCRYPSLKVDVPN